MKALKDYGIIALDMPATEGFDLATRLTGHVWGVKGNSALFERTWDAGSWITRMRDRGLNVFADAKLHDIPQTVANSVAVLAKQGANLITVHASGGNDMIRAAVETYDKHRPEGGLGILAVTVLTSLDGAECEFIYGNPPDKMVVYFGDLADILDCHGIVCSAKQLSALTGRFPELKRIVPGTRLPGMPAHDQKNVDTPANAIRHGADYLVIGREVTQAVDPLAALAAVEATLN